MNLNLFDNVMPISNAWSESPWPADFWPTLFDQVPYSLIVFEPTGRILMANNEAIRRLGLTSLDDFALPETLKPLKAGILKLEPRGNSKQVVTMPYPADGNPLTFHLRYLSCGEDGLILASGQPDSTFDSLDESVDETAAMATAVRRQVTGSLSGIELYASIVGQELEESGDSSLVDLIEQIRCGVREVNEYLASFSTVSEPLTLNCEICQVMDIIDETLSTLNGVLKEHNIGVLVTQKDLSVRADRGLLVQAILNILLNAVEAMAGGGRIFIEFDVDANGLIEIVITDTGPGLPKDMMKRAFSPFYTTKDQPLGLGLPVSLRIAEAHQGSLVVGVDLNMGTRAVLSLPWVPAEGKFHSSLN